MRTWGLLLLVACGAPDRRGVQVTSQAGARTVARTDLAVQAPAPVTDASAARPDEAVVSGVVVKGEPGAYTFAVTVRSPDTGCDRYADWWEVLTPDGALVYRRILEHSHPDEQPFTRGGGPVPVAPEDALIVRAHLAPGGYGAVGLRGSVRGGFVTTTLDPRFAAEVERQAPQPAGCRF